MMFRKLLGISILAVGILLLLFAAALLQSANPFDRSSHLIVIQKGATGSSVQTILENNEILRPHSGFALIARVLGISKHIQAGKYKFSSSETLIGILLKLKNGDVHVPLPKRVWVTFPEGTSIYKMAEILKKAGVKDYKKFQGLTKEGITEELRERHWGLFKYVPTESLEGFLYPDTYWFFEKAPMEDLVEVMIRRFEEKVLPFWETAQKDTKYSLFEIITLASIIEKEAQKPEEREIISSVFHNRLDLGMYLAACPTIKYALGRPTKIVYYEQLEIDSPYNTYKHKGLPPGPICNPGIASIKAAVYPADTDYCYFVAKKDGSHIFSKTGAEHQKAREKVGIKGYY